MVAVPVAGDSVEFSAYESLFRGSSNPAPGGGIGVRRYEPALRPSGTSVDPDDPYGWLFQPLTSVPAVLDESLLLGEPAALTGSDGVAQREVVSPLHRAPAPGTGRGPLGLRLRSGVLVLVPVLGVLAVLGAATLSGEGEAVRAALTLLRL